MSTRSYIAIQHADGSIDAISCHYDGYPTGVGATLAEHYQTSDKVQRLISLGDLSCLGTSPDKKPGELPELDETTAYHRDWGEDLFIRHFDTAEELQKSFADSDAEYLYLYTQAAISKKWTWYVSTVFGYDNQYTHDSIEHAHSVGIIANHWYTLSQMIEKYSKLEEINLASLDNINAY